MILMDVYRLAVVGVMNELAGLGLAAGKRVLERGEDHSTPRCGCSSLGAVTWGGSGRVAPRKRPKPSAGLVRALELGVLPAQRRQFGPLVGDEMVVALVGIGLCLPRRASGCTPTSTAGFSICGFGSVPAGLGVPDSDPLIRDSHTPVTNGFVGRAPPKGGTNGRIPRCLCHLPLRCTHHHRTYRVPDHGA